MHAVDKEAYRQAKVAYDGALETARAAAAPAEVCDLLMTSVCHIRVGSLNHHYE